MIARRTCYSYLESSPGHPGCSRDRNPVKVISSMPVQTSPVSIQPPVQWIWGLSQHKAAGYGGGQHLLPTGWGQVGSRIKLNKNLTKKPSNRKQTSHPSHNQTDHWWLSHISVSENDDSGQNLLLYYWMDRAKTEYVVDMASFTSALSMYQIYKLLSLLHS